MHGVWTIILDDDFLQACKYGIVIECIDGVERRVYPRIFDLFRRLSREVSSIYLHKYFV